MLTLEERAEAILRNIGCPITPVNTRFMLDCLRAAINDKLEEAAVELEKMERRQMRDGTAAMLVREMKVKW